MSQILLKNDVGESVVASVVRYFQYNNQLYMLYTLNEVDASNYIKLYGIKLSVNETGSIVGTMIDDNDWAVIVPLVKEMVKPASERVATNFQDLNPSSISNINLISKRIFKINKDMSDLLVNNASINTEVVNSQNSTNVNYQQTQNIDTNINTNIDNNIGTNANEQQNVSSSLETMVQPVQQSTVDYRQLYEQELQHTEQLNSEIQILKTKIANIENIIKG